MNTDLKTTGLSGPKPKPSRKPTTITETADLIKAIGPDRQRLAEAGFSTAMVRAAWQSGLITGPMCVTVQQCIDPNCPW